MSEIPHWEEDFPISWVDDHYVTRREFTKSLVWVSCSAFAAPGVLLAIDIAKSKKENEILPQMKVADIGDIPVGGSRVFRYPTPDNPCILVRLELERFVAYNQKCTHLGCPVAYRPKKKRLYCPCHEGFFDATDGKVLAGPPPRPLPAVQLERRGDEIWAIGLGKGE